MPWKSKESDGASWSTLLQEILEWSKKLDSHIAYARRAKTDPHIQLFRFLRLARWFIKYCTKALTECIHWHMIDKNELFETKNTLVFTKLPGVSFQSEKCQISLKEKSLANYFTWAKRQKLHLKNCPQIGTAIVKTF